MKKTEKTALTAAMLTAALNLLPTGSMTPANGANQQNMTVSAADSKDPVSTLREEMAGVYGPPSWFTTPVTEAVTEPADLPEPIPQQTQMAAVYGPPSWFTKPVTEPATEPPVAVTTELGYSQPDYGPPWVFAPKGDFNLDFDVNVFDLVAARQAYVKSMSGKGDYHLNQADLNDDGAFTMADLVVLNKYLLGQIPDFEPEEITPQPTYGVIWIEPEPTEPLIPDPTEEVPVLMYGPPIAWEEEPTDPTYIEEPADPDIPTPTFAPVYGPPPSWD